MRIAGVNVGQVTSIKREGNTGLVTMEIESKGPPIHEDATHEDPPPDLPRRQLVRRTAARQPSLADLPSGSTIPIAQTADPVQLDQVLDALNTDTRENLQHFLIYYGEGLTEAVWLAEEDAEQEPEVRGLNAAQALNKTYDFAPPSLRGTAVVQQAFAGVTDKTSRS